MWRTGVVALALVGCSQIFGLDVPTVSTGPTDDAPPGTVTIGGQVLGLVGAGLVLQDNGGDDKPIASDGKYTFPTAVPLGSTYDVTVSVQPTNPSEMCTVANGSGTASSNIVNVDVACAALSYSIGGTVVGLTGSVTLHNGSDAQTITMNGAFTFPTAVVSGQPYSVTATGNGACVVFGGTGTVGNADVTSVVVNCGSASGPYTIGGMISGLNGSVVLQNNVNNDQVTLSANGTYAFPTPIPSAGAYNVTVRTQPSYPPAKQTCTVANGMSTANGNVQNINVTCTTASFAVGGSINGLSGTLVLQDNGADDLTRTTNGGFAFATPVLSGSTYAVTVKTQPATQTCTVSNSTGTVTNGNVTNVNPTCASADAGVKCGANTCTGSQGCCDPTGSKTCKLQGGCTSSLWMPCDDTADCGSGKICCAATNGGGTVTSVSCSSTCGGADLRLCDPNASNSCPVGGVCAAYSGLPGYYACQ